MPFTLAGQPLQKAAATFPRFRSWSAEVSVAGPLDLAAGARTSLVLGDLSLACTVLSGGTWAGESRYTVVAGAGGWSRPVVERPYRDDATGPMLGQVVSDLALEVGERAQLDTADRALGYAWVRPAGTAAERLEALVGDAWWVDGDGLTHAGPRPTSTVARPQISVQRYAPELRRATVAVADDAFAALLPGATLQDPGLPAPLPIGETTIRVAPGSVLVELLGERPPSELLVAIMRSRAAGGRLLGGPFPYQVGDDSTGRPTLRPFGGLSRGLPELPYIDKIPGMPGGTSQLAPDAVVLVGFQAGDPGSPYVAAYLGPTLPLQVGFDVAPGGQIRAGGASADSVALATPTQTMLDALTAAFNALSTAAAGHGIGTGAQVSPSSVASTKLLAE